MLEHLDQYFTNYGHVIKIIMEHILLLFLKHSSKIKEILYFDKQLPVILSQKHQKVISF